jgi:hypothetical protein
MMKSRPVTWHLPQFREPDSGVSECAKIADAMTQWLLFLFPMPIKTSLFPAHHLPQHALPIALV